MRQWLKIMKEDTYGTVPTDPDPTDVIWIDMEENDPTIDVTPQMYVINSALPSRGVTKRLTGASQYSVGGQIQTALYHEHANFWEEAVFEPTVTSGIPNLPSYTIHRAYADNGGVVKAEQFTGCKFTAVTVTGSNQAAQAPIRLNLTVQGSRYIEDVALTAPTCSVFPTSVYLWSGVDLDIGGTSLKSLIRDLNLSITHRTNPIFHANQYADRIAYYGWDVSLATNYDMESHTIRNKFLDILTSFSAAKYNTGFVDFIYAVDKKVRFNLYNVLFSAVNPQRPPGGDHMYAATLGPYYDCTNLDMTCTVTNPA